MQRYNKNFKQMVEIPKAVSSTLFSLPCVEALLKDNIYPFVLRLHRVQNLDGTIANWAMSGDWLGVDYNGQWWLIKQDES
jgi:hypothetical protein